MKANPRCRICGVALDGSNWNPSQQKKTYICKGCHSAGLRSWRKANPEQEKANHTRNNRNHGHRPFDKNKECSSFLGVHVAERMLSHVFKDVKRMPYGHPGYDVICNRNKKIDIKSACQRKKGTWEFHIKHNTIADFFLCLAFDNREDLNPLHAWLIPGSKLNHLEVASIRPSKIYRWDAYRLDLSKISTCCDAMR